MEKGKTADFLVVVNESTQNECREHRHMVFFVDITDESKPLLGIEFSRFPRPAATSVPVAAVLARTPSNESFTADLLQAHHFRHLLQRRRAGRGYAGSLPAARR